jgi:hypothetical protein
VRAKPWEAIDVFDLAQQLGVEVRFANIASMEGLYLRQDAPVILVPSERPAGRQRFSCAHELGHHVFGDGSHIDELFDAQAHVIRKDDEILADMFAGMLLMPKTAVDRAFSVRNLDPRTAEPVDFYRIACWLGVGYATLVGHMHFALGALSEERCAEIDRHSPKAIRVSTLGQSALSEELILVDEQWTARPVDAAVGDFILLPRGVDSEGASCEWRGALPSGELYQAVAPGVGRFESSNGWASFVRVARKHFEGRSIFRHLEEIEHD